MTETKTPPENITSFHLSFAIISTHLTCRKRAKYPGTKLVGVVFVLRKSQNEKFTRVCSRSKTLKFRYFTLLFCEERKNLEEPFKNLEISLFHVVVLRRTEKKCTKIYNSGVRRFSSLSLLLCGVAVAVVVVVAEGH